MLDQAFSPTQRSNPEIQKLRVSVEKVGSRGLLGALYIALHRPILDDVARELLRQNYLSAPGAMFSVYTHYNARLKSLKEQASADDWGEFVDEVRQVAERLWRDKFLPLLARPNPEEVSWLAGTVTPPSWPEILQKSESEQGGTPALPKDSRTTGLISNQNMIKMMRDPTSAESQALQLACNVARLLLVLWLDGRLSEYRADVNKREFQQQAGQGMDATGKAIHQAIRRRILEYKQVLHDWDDELRNLTGRPLFIARFADVQRFRTLGKEFLTTGKDGDAGWAAQSGVAYDELRYQVFEELRKGSVTWLSFPIAGFLWFIQLTTGYGMKPLRFVWTGAATILIFMILFFFNDYFNPGIVATSHFCPQAAIDHTPWYLIPVHYLYLAVTNLSSLGSDSSIAHYCGGVSTQVLLTLAALTGYFLLAMLAALLFKLLMEAV